jgi:hypothetical protein
MTVPARYTWELVRGDDSTRIITYQDPDGAAIDLTGFTAVLEVTRAGTQTDIAATITDAAGGEITAHIDHEVSEDWSSNGTFKLRVIDAADEVTTILMGDLEVIQ